MMVVNNQKNAPARNKRPITTSNRRDTGEATRRSNGNNATAPDTTVKEAAEEYKLKVTPNPTHSNSIKGNRKMENIQIPMNFQKLTTLQNKFEKICIQKSI